VHLVGFTGIIQHWALTAYQWNFSSMEEKK
jgi:hypothetical protein